MAGSRSTYIYFARRWTPYTYAITNSFNGFSKCALESKLRSSVNEKALLALSEPTGIKISYRGEPSVELTTCVCACSERGKSFHRAQALHAAHIGTNATH